jgi:hypothetical protein
MRDQFHAPAALYLGVGDSFWCTVLKGRWLGHTADREGGIPLPYWVTNPVPSVAWRSDSCYLYLNIRTSLELCMNVRACPPLPYTVHLQQPFVPPATDRFHSRSLHTMLIARSEPAPSVSECRPVPAPWHLAVRTVRKTEQEGGSQTVVASLARRIPSPPFAFLKYLPSVKMWELDCRWSAFGFRERRIFRFSTASKLAVWP